MDLIYVYHDECEPCKEVGDLVDLLNEDGFNIRKVEWEDVMYSKFNVPTPAFYVGENLITSSTLLSSLFIYNHYPEIFKEESKLNLIKFILNNPKHNLNP